MEKIILQTTNLSIGYFWKHEKNVIAKGIDIALKSGKLISLIGVNGIGKSTLLRTIAGIQKPLDGDIALKGKNINRYNAMELSKQLSLVLTEKLPPSNLSVFELIALGRQPYTNWLGTMTREDLEIVNNAIKITNCGLLSDKKHYEISDGQLQKVLVARALAQDTPLIVLDEPGTHLDLENKISLFQILKKLADQSGKCILFSTHDIEMAIQLSDEMIVMQPGSIQQGTPDVLIANNTFDTLFPNENISFDREKVKFVFKNG